MGIGRRRSAAFIVIFTISVWLCVVPDSRAAPTHDVYAIRNARVVMGTGQTLEKAHVIMRDGLIAAVGADVEIPFNAEVMDGEGLTVYPGFIDAHTSLGLKLPEPQSDQDTPPDTSKDASAAMREANRKGIRPELLAAQFFTLNAEGGSAHRRVGFTAALVAPPGGVLAGQSALVNLSGEPRRDVVLKSPVALHTALQVSGSGYPGTLMGILAHLRQTLLDAQHYRWHRDRYQRNGGVRRPPLDDVLAALAPALDGVEPVIFEADSENDIKRVLDLANEFRLRVILSGGTEGWKVAEQLTAAKVPIILSLDFGTEPTDPDKKPPTPPTAPPTPSAVANARRSVLYETGNGTASVPYGIFRVQEQETPSTGEAASRREREREQDPYRVRKERRQRWEERVANAAKLHQAGVAFAFSTKGLDKPGEFFDNLEKVIAAGLPREVALRALTVEPAQLFGMARHLGTIETGKLANLVVMDGEFAVKNVKVRAVFVDGKRFDVEARASTSTPRTPPAPGVDLSGEWTLSFSTPAGEREVTLTLKQSQSGDLTGEVKSERGGGKITDAYISGTQVKLTWEVTFSGRTVRLQATGDVQGDTMSGTLNTPFGSATWKATKKPSARFDGVME